MNLKELKYKANYYTLLLLIFVTPLERRLGPPLIGLFVLTSFINGDLKQNKKKTVLLFTTIFALYLISLFYSTNFNTGVEDLIKKLSLLVFPIAVFVSRINYREKMNSFFRAFIDGCFASGILSLIVSTINYHFTLDNNSFFYGNSSVFLHTSYFAMYANFSILIIYHFIFTENNNKYFTIKRLLLLLFFSIMIITSTSKTGLISLVIIHGCAILYWIVKEKAWVKGIFTIFTFSIALTSVFIISSTVRNRVNELINVTATGDTSSGSTTAARIEIWKISLDLIKEKPLLGYGVGDVHEKLTNQYLDKGYLELYKKKLNAHNQWLQTTLSTGLIGGLLLLLIFIIPMYMSGKKQEFLYLFFLLLVLFNLLTESMFLRQAGVVFYALFNAVFFSAVFDYSDRKKI